MTIRRNFIKSILTVVAVIIIFLTSCQSKSGKTDGWKDLFDGKTLNGWKIINQDWENPDSKPDFYVEDNMIICNTVLNSRGAYLVTEKKYDNFILEFDVKIDSFINSGMQCRGQIWEKDTSTVYLSGKLEERKRNWKAGYVWGYQVEIETSNRKWSGGLYEPGNRGWLVTLEGKEEAQKAFKLDEWNHFKILMDGNKIQTWINGVPIVDTTDEMSASGFIGIQFHGAGRKQKDQKSRWKNIRIKEL